jgi:hypothetical protein
MKSKPVTLPWNAAAWRQSTYEPRVYKVCDPVGSPHINVACISSDAVCQGCGYHVCSCKTIAPARRGTSQHGA